MIRILGVLFLTIVLGTTSVQSQTLPDDSAYADCLLKNISPDAGESFINAVKLACRIKHPSNWIDASQTLTCVSPQTRNMGNVRLHGGCESSSPEGKYCADVVELNCSLEPDDRFEYRFQQYSGECPGIWVASGPSAWHEIISCSLNQDGTEFTATIKGWTLPQSFETDLSIELRYR